jgi:hypothetical protein
MGLMLVGLTLASPNDGSTAPAPAGEVARFEIVEGMEPSKDKGRRTMFRIDTFTGRTWVMDQVPLKTGDVVGRMTTWLDVAEMDNELTKRVMQALDTPGKQ